MESDLLLEHWDLASFLGDQVRSTECFTPSSVPRPLGTGVNAGIIP